MPHEWQCHYYVHEIKLRMSERERNIAAATAKNVRAFSGDAFAQLPHNVRQVRHKHQQ